MTGDGSEVEEHGMAEDQEGSAPPPPPGTEGRPGEEGEAVDTGGGTTEEGTPQGAAEEQSSQTQEVQCANCASLILSGRKEPI